MVELTKPPQTTYDKWSPETITEVFELDATDLTVDQRKNFSKYY